MRSKLNHCMNMPVFIKHLPLILRAAFQFETDASKTDSLRLSYQLVCWLVVVVTNIISMDWEETVPVKDIYEIIMFGAAFSYFVIFLRNRKNLAKFVKCTMEPFYVYQVNLHRSIIEREYVTVINLYGTAYFIVFFIFGGFLPSVIFPLLALSFYPDNTPIQDLPLPSGRIPFYTESYAVYTVAYVLSASANITMAFFALTVFALISFSAFRIKTLLRLLIDSVECLDSRAEQRLKARGATDGHHLECLSSGHHLEAQECLKETVQNHVEIIGYVKLVDGCFRAIHLIFFQSSIFFVAVGLIQNIDVYKSRNYEIQEAGNIRFALICTFICAVFNYVGQGILDESERLSQALYNCNWLTRDKVFKKHLRIMMMVSARPVCLTVGGIFPLSYETFGRVMTAAYSYFNVMLGAVKEK